MTDSLHDFGELRDLLDALCEETITAAQMSRLEELVLAHPEAEAYYIQCVSLHADLARHFAALPGRTEESLLGHIAAGQPPPDTSAAAPASRPARGSLVSLSSRRLVAAGLAAVLLAALTLPWHGTSELPTPPRESVSESIDASVAVFLRAHAAEWEEADPPLRRGAPLSPGRLRLKSGVAQIEFYSGATVILEGPADFRLVSSREAYCALGKLRVIVPPQARGFTVGSPRLDVVDRGTEFGLRVSGDRTEVHVFQGSVALYDAGSGRSASGRRELKAGRGLRLDGPASRPIESDPGAFLTAQKLAGLIDDDVRARQREWAAASDELRRDPTLEVYYPFQAEPPWSRTLLDQADGRRQPHDGAIIGGLWGIGRWPGKQGLEFKRLSDRVRFHVPGEFDALTLAAWVRVDALPNRYNPLMMTDGWDDSAPHWYIRDEGWICLGVQGPDQRGGVNYNTPKVFLRERLGQWVHLAVVYDRKAGEVAHYVDGRAVKRDRLKLDRPLRIGDAELGNWNAASYPDRYPVRFFTGCMDEFMLFSRPLSDDEVRQRYDEGRPPL
jgi:hypothetical protein